MAGARGIAIREARLDNGLRLVSAHMPELPYLALRLEVFAGTAHEPPDCPGLALLTATALADAGNLSERAEDLGGALAAHAEPERCGLSLSVPSGAGGEALRLLREAIAGRPGAGLPLARARRAMDLSQQAQDAGAQADRLLLHAVFGDHAYGRAPGGDLEWVQKAPARAAAAFHRQNMGPDNAALIIAGAMDFGAAVKAARKAFGGWRAAATPGPRLPAPPSSSPAFSFFHAPGHPTCEWGFAWPAAAAAAEQSAAQRLAAAVFAGGFTSQLMQRLRVQSGLVYAVTGEVRAHRSGGAFLVRCACEPDKATRVAARVSAAAGAVARSGLKKEEIEAAGAWLSGVSAFAVERAGELAAELGRRAALGLAPLTDTAPLTRVEASPAEVSAAARAMFAHPPVVVAVGPMPEAEGRALYPLRR